MFAKLFSFKFPAFSHFMEVVDASGAEIHLFAVSQHHHPLD